MRKIIYEWVLLIAILFVAAPITYAEPFMDWHKKVSAYEAQYGYGKVPKDVIKELIEAAEPLVQQGSNDPRFYARLADLWKELDSLYYYEYNPQGKYHGSPEVQMMRDKQNFLIR